MKKLDKKGFAAIEAVLIVVVLGILGFTGWFVWHAKQNTDDSLNKAASSQQGIVKASSKATDFASCKAATGSTLLESYPEKCVTKDGKSFIDTSGTMPVEKPYLTIKELSIMLPLSTGITDAYYYFANNSAYLSVHSLDGTACAADKTSIGAISTTDVASAATQKVNGKNYAYYSPQAGCSDDAATQAKADTARQALVQAFKQVTTTDN
jgi:hypothetical protein